MPIPRPFVPKPKPWRPQRTKRMSLVMGIFCSDGLLLTADREESGGVAKRSVQKLFEVRPNGDWVMVIGTAGHSAFSDFTTRAIARAALQKHDTFIADREQIMSDTLRDVYRDYMYCVPKEVREDRTIELLIGIKSGTGDAIFLYKTADEILNPASEYACCGIGEDVANYFLDRLYDPMLTERQLIAFSAFVVREAKVSVGGVGKETDCVFLPNAEAVRKGAGYYTSYRHGTVTDALLPQLSHIVSPFWHDTEALGEEIKRQLLFESGLGRL